MVTTQTRGEVEAIYTTILQTRKGKNFIDFVRMSFMDGPLGYRDNPLIATPKEKTNKLKGL